MFSVSWDYEILKDQLWIIFSEIGTILLTNLNLSGISLSLNGKSKSKNDITTRGLRGY